MQIGDAVGFHKSYDPNHWGDPMYEVVWYGVIKEVVSPRLVNISFIDNVGERVFLVLNEDIRPIKGEI